MWVYVYGYRCVVYCLKRVTEQETHKPNWIQHKFYNKILNKLIFLLLLFFMYQLKIFLIKNFNNGKLTMSLYYC